jgi:putative DNA primase/helicase
VGRTVGPASSFDRDPWLLGVNNGIADLRTGDLVNDDAEHYVTRTSPIDYVQRAESPAWLAHIESVFDGDTDVAHCFQKQIGAALVGDAETLKPQVLLQLLGPSGGGKGLATHTLRWVLGSHAASLRAQDFTDGADRHPQWMTRLRGARLAVVEEMKGKTLDVGLLKQLSRGDSVVANEMRMADKEWVPTHTLIFTSNTAPDFGNDPDGMRRRYVPLPTGPERWGDDTDGTYARRLRVDAEGILT